MKCWQDEFNLDKYKWSAENGVSKNPILNDKDIQVVGRTADYI